MSTVVGVAHKFDEWPDETSWTTSPIFTSFGEGISLADHQFWNPNSPGTIREELAHGFDAADNFDSGYTNDNIADLGHGIGSSELVFDRQQQATTRPEGQLGHSQSSNHFSFSRSKRSYVGNCHEVPVDEDVLFDDNLTTSTVTAPSKRLSRSPETKRSPCCSPRSAVSSAGSANGAWMGEGVADELSPVSATADVPMAAPRNKRNRERNRVAAHKCRQKAKHSMSQLQERERELSSQNRVLHEHASSLRDEILDLKNEILRHSNCDSDVIQNYIARAARDLH
ncbi:hypothetical protein GGR53DRAFT_377171 [Hypoxylon sp. FL1150]|nr:hypothetical protein GGR53DRAFT_377171 [Hypoxylon sp. FL1150]